MAGELDEILPRLPKNVADDVRARLGTLRPSPTEKAAAPGKAADSPKLAFTLATADVIPSCMTAQRKVQRNRGPVQDLWDEGPVLGTTADGKPVKVAAALLIGVGLLSVEWLTRKLLRLAWGEGSTMPLLAHFHPPIKDTHHWESIHSRWASEIADVLNAQWLSSEFLAEEHTHPGANLEVDVATYQLSNGLPRGPDGGSVTATLTPRTWAPPAAALTIPSLLPEGFEVRVFNTAAGRTLVAVVEFISPGNKDRPEARRAFATKCASYLYGGVAVIVMDIVTNYRFNLHNETMRLMNAPPAADLPPEPGLYAVAYRPVLRDNKSEIDLWPATFALGDALPTLPLRLTGDAFVPIDFEASYQRTCRSRRLA